MEIVKYNVNEAAISKMSDIYLNLKVKDINDKDGFDAVHSAKMVMVKHRTGIEKLRKSTNKDAQDFIRINNANAGTLIALMQPIEFHLATEEKKITDEKKRIKEEKAADRRLITQNRVDTLFQLGVVRPFDDVAMYTDDEYKYILTIAQAEYDAEQFRIKKAKLIAEEKEKKIAADLAEIEKTRIEQAKKAKEIADKEAAIEANLKAIEDEKIREAEEKEREIFQKQAAEDARIQAEKDAKEKAEHKTRELLKKQEAEETERQAKELLKPDKEKLIAWITSFNNDNNPVPELKSIIAQDILTSAINIIKATLQKIFIAIDEEL